MSLESTSISVWAAKVSLLSEPFLYICIAPIRQGDVMCLQLLELNPCQHKTHKSCARRAPPATFFRCDNKEQNALTLEAFYREPCFSLTFSDKLLSLPAQKKKIQSAAHRELHPIRGRFGSLFLNCRVWRICFSASMNLPLIKADSCLCSLSVLTDTFIVPAAHTHSLNNNMGGIFIGAYQCFLVRFVVRRMLCRRGT